MQKVFTKTYFSLKNQPHMTLYEQYQLAAEMVLEPNSPGICWAMSKAGSDNMYWLRRRRIAFPEMKLFECEFSKGSDPSYWMDDEYYSFVGDERREIACYVLLFAAEISKEKTNK